MKFSSFKKKDIGDFNFFLIWLNKFEKNLIESNFYTKKYLNFEFPFI
jgi:hypothetical protein